MKNWNCPFCRGSFETTVCPGFAVIITLLTLLLLALVLAGCGDKEPPPREFPVTPCCDESKEPPIPATPPEPPKPKPKPKPQHYIDKSPRETLDVMLEYTERVKATAQYKGAILGASGETRDEAIDSMRNAWNDLRYNDQWPR